MALSEISAGSPIKLADINGVIRAVNNIQTSSNPVRHCHSLCRQHEHCPGWISALRGRGGEPQYLRGPFRYYRYSVRCG